MADRRQHPREDEETMRYMFLIYTPESEDPQPGQPAFDEMMQGYAAFAQELDRRNAKHVGDPLQPVATATTIRVRNGKTLTTDGPFAETKEQLAGYYIIDCKDLDEALELAPKIPGSWHGSVEVRPIMEM